MMHSHDYYWISWNAKCWMIHMFQADRAEWRPKKPKCAISRLRNCANNQKENKEHPVSSQRINSSQEVLNFWIQTHHGVSFAESRQCSRNTTWTLFFGLPARCVLTGSQGMLTFSVQQLRCKKLFLCVTMGRSNSTNSCCRRCFFPPPSCRLTSGWERAVRSRMPATEASSGTCAASPCAWWRPLCDGTVVPPGTLWAGRRWRWASVSSAS